MSDPNYQDVQYSSKVMVGCGCRNLKDVVTFIRERRIQYVELAWADEMGLWHNELVPVSQLTYASLQEGVQCKDGRFLLPDPLSARIAPLTQPNVMLFTCTPPTSRSSNLKTKQLSADWIEMISKKLMENDKRPTMDRILNGDFEEPGFCYGVPGSPSYSIARSPDTHSPRSPTGSPGSPGTLRHSGNLNSTSGFVEWQLARNESFGSPPTLKFPPSPLSDSSSSPPGSVPSSPSLPRSPRSPGPLPDSGQEREEVSETKTKNLCLPPLLRPRQIHPTKANKLGITKPVKKRRNTEHLFCRHCGTTETPEWRRGPDGRKSLCNACGLYFSKMVKRETMVVPQGHRVAIDALLNPHC